MTSAVAKLRTCIAEYDEYDHNAFPLEALQEAADEIAYLRAGIRRIADGYGGDVTSFAQNLLDGKV